MFVTRGYGHEEVDGENEREGQIADEYCRARKWLQRGAGNQEMQKLGNEKTEYH